MRAPSRFLGRALPVLLTWLAAGFCIAQEEQSVALKRVTDWELAYQPLTEAGSTCLASRSSGEILHLVGLSGRDGIWFWEFRLMGAKGIAAGSSHQLVFEFDTGRSHSVSATGMNETSVRAQGLSSQLIEDLANSNRLTLTLDGEPLDNLDLTDIGELIDALEICHQEEALPGNASKLGDQGAEAEIDRLNQQVVRHIGNGEYDPGIELAEEVLTKAERTLGDKDPTTAVSLSNLAELYHYKGRYAEAEQLYRKALALRERTLGPEHPDVAESLNNLAGLYDSLGRYTEAEPLFMKSQEIWEKTLGPEHPDVAESLNNLAVLYASLGRYAEAEPLYKRSLAIWEKALGPEHPDVAVSLNNLAGLYDSLGRYTEAEPMYRESLALREQALSPEHPDIALSLNNLASFYVSQGRFAEAEPLLERSLAIWEKALGPEHPDVALGLNNLAGLYDSQGNYAEAEPLFREALILRENALGPEHPTVATSLNNLAELYNSEGRYAEAEPLYKRSLAIREKILGPEHPDVAMGIDNLTSLYETQGRYAEAESLYQRALAINEKALGPEHPSVAISLGNLAGLYETQGRYAEAESFYQRALAINEKALGPEHPSVATRLNSLAVVYDSQGRYAEAEPLYKRSLTIWEKTGGPEHSDVALGLSNLAGLYESLGHYAEAESLYLRALAIDEKALEPEHPSVVTSLNNLAVLYLSQGRYAEAEPLFKRSLAIWEKVHGPEHPDVALGLSNLAVLYDVQGRYGEAEPLYERSLILWEKALGPEHPDVALSLSNMAVLFVSQGRYAEAEPLYKKSLAVQEKVLGPLHPEFASGLNNLASLYEIQGRYAEAEPLYKKSLALREKSLGAEHPDVADGLNDLAGLYETLGRYAKAETLYEKSLALWEKTLGPEHTKVATNLNNLAGLYKSEGRYAEAESLYQRALAIDENAFGLEHPDVALSLNNLALLCSHQGRHTEAEALYEKSLALWEKTLGPEHPHVATCLDNLAWLYSAQEKPELEQPLRRRVQRIDAERLQEGLAGKQGEAMTDQRDHALAYLQLLSQLDRPGAEDRADALTAVQLARRAERGEAFRLLAQRLAAGGSGELASLVRQRQDLNWQLQALEKQLVDSYGLPAAERPEGLAERLRTRIEDIGRQESAFSERLQREFPAYTEFEGSRLADLASLQQVLRPGEAALAWVLGAEESYLLVVPREGDLRLRTLAVTEAEVAEKVQRLHRALDLGDPSHYGDLAPFPAALAAELFVQLFGPDWQADLAGVDQLLLVPEGPLTRLAFPVLLTEPSQQAEFGAYSSQYEAAPWLARRFSVSVLPSLSALTALRGEAAKGQATHPFLGVGDPLLDDHPARTRGVEKIDTTHISLVRNVRGAERIQPPPASPDEMRQVRLERIRQHPSLPDTAEELERIAKLLGAGEQALLLRDAATEHRVKQTALNQYGILSFATHGVLSGELGQGIEPGLILTPPPEATEEDDGFLGLSEVAQLKLNADLVVLSACNTGGGVDSEAMPQAEGFTGLAKAFSYAGAKALLVSHWSVSSAATVELMEHLFRGYRGEQLSRAEAHRQAMLAMIGGGEPLFRHPSLWAPFVVVGEGG